MQDEFMKKDNSIWRLLILGAITMVACMLACLFIVISINKEFSSTVESKIYEKHIISGKVLDKDIQEVFDTVKSGADYLTSLEGVAYSKVYQLMGAYDNLSVSPYLLYISTTGTILYDDKEYHRNDNEQQFSEIYKRFDEGFKDKYQFGHFFNDVNLGKTQMLISNPVCKKGTLIGYFVAVIDMDSVLADCIVAENDNGNECYVIDSQFETLCSARGATVVKNNRNILFEFTEKFSDSKKNEDAIEKFKKSVNRNEPGYFSLITKDKQNELVAYSRLQTIPNYYCVTCFKVNLVEDEVQPIIFKVTLVCILIMALMQIVIVYEWATAKKTNLTIEKLAYEDSVTKGKNIYYFKNFVSEIMTVFKETPFVIYRFDIANFRYINESYGHNKADEILVSCISNFEKIFSDKELCIRMNADQFLAIMVNDKMLEQRIAQYCANVNLDVRSKGIKYPIKFKTGIYQIKKHDKDIDVMIDHANVARKTLSSSGKVMKAVFTENIIMDMRKIDKIESDMQRALATGEFVVYYQPKWDIVSNHIAGAEALARWIKPDGTVIYPDTFIPIFEKNGFIEKLDFYILETVCIQLRDMMDKGRTLYPISVNQSRLLLHSPDYVENVKKIIKKYNIPGNAIELEITETVFKDEREEMIDTMLKLKEIGVKLSMDDFGSGYSSLNMLKDVPFDIIKIDREFFSESVTSDVSMWILQKIIEMVNGLGMEIICEGVETGEQSSLLRGIGCRLVQGYFYSKPIPSEQYFDDYC